MIRSTHRFLEGMAQRCHRCRHTDGELLKAQWLLAGRVYASLSPRRSEGRALSNQLHQPAERVESSLCLQHRITINKVHFASSRWPSEGYASLRGESSSRALPLRQSVLNPLKNMDNSAEFAVIWRVLPGHLVVRSTALQPEQGSCAFNSSGSLGQFDQVA